MGRPSPSIRSYDPIRTGVRHGDALLLRTLALHRHVDFVSRTLLLLGVPSSRLNAAVQMVLLVFERKFAATETDSERQFVFQIALRVASDVWRTL
jgi:hypothetical protein